MCPAGGGADRAAALRPFPRPARPAKGRAAAGSAISGRREDGGAGGSGAARRARACPPAGEACAGFLPAAAPASLGVNGVRIARERSGRARGVFRQAMAPRDSVERTSVRQAPAAAVPAVPDAVPDAAVLVTGGAGYIGSHTVLALRQAGRRVVVLDDLSTGCRAVVPPDVTFIAGDAGNADLVASLIARHRIGAVLHFAGSILVEQSVSEIGRAHV